MSCMKEKIKKIFEFLHCAVSGGWRGIVGLIVLFIALMMFVGVFWGERNIQRFIANIWELNREQAILDAAHRDLDDLNRHIELLQKYSTDYIEELGLKHLNMGDPKIKILKI